MSAMTRISTLGFLLVVLAAGCQSAGEQKPLAQELGKAQVLKVDQDGVQRVTVLAGSYFFRPNHIIVKADTPVEILASREAGLAPHDLVIQAPDGATLVQQDLATEPRKIAFTPRKPGKYPMYCSKKPPLMASHRERGMEGMLEVVP
jgi:plastocyanin